MNETVLYARDDLHPGVCRIALFEDPKAVALRTLCRHAFHDGVKAPNPTSPGPALTYSFRGGRLDVYLVRRVRSEGRQPVLNMSNAVQLSHRFVQEQLLELDPSPARVDDLLATVGDHVVACAKRSGAWVPADHHRLGVTPTLAAMAYPLLGQALEHGFTAPHDSVPTSVSATLRRPTARQAAGHAFGAKATRPVIRAMAASLLHGTATNWSDRRLPVNLLNIELAVACRQVFEPDQLAALLTQGPTNGERLLGLDALALRTARRFLADLHPTRVGRLVGQTLTLPEGPRYFRDLIRMWGLVGTPAPALLPRDLVAAHDALVEQIRTAELPDLELDAFPPELRALDGHEVGDSRIVVPATTRTLAEWGRQMHNCIGGYVVPAWCGETWLLGVESFGELRFNIEIRPGGGIEQFVGPFNRPAPPAVVTAVTHVLEAAGVMSLTAPPRRPPHPELLAFQAMAGALPDEEPF